jgi:NADPH-dependent ferric siderophore reductase
VSRSRPTRRCLVHLTHWAYVVRLGEQCGLSSITGLWMPDDEHRSPSGSVGTRWLPSADGTRTTRPVPRKLLIRDMWASSGLLELDVQLASHRQHGPASRTPLLAPRGSHFGSIVPGQSRTPAAIINGTLLPWR